MESYMQVDERTKGLVAWMFQVFAMRVMVAKCVDALGSANGESLSSQLAMQMGR